MLTPALFQRLLLTWFDQHGRKHLPWQENKTPYRVWVSEIMLQQTQVATVIPYFLKFMQRFPTLEALAQAQQDDVLHLWAGLGYYSRGRNLHKAAQMVMQEFGGIFPATLQELQTLPGIGPSTAGAILAIAFNQQSTILDGNVKRVLTRLHGISTPINEKPTENVLWEIATSYTPAKRVADYTQAMMDLGATLCTRGQPACQRCPVMSHCVAHKEDIATSLPVKKAGRVLPVRTATFIVFKHANQVLLHKRPSSGIWGGLWSLPELSGMPEEEAIRAYCYTELKVTGMQFSALPAFRHTFSHYHLDIHPIVITLKKLPAKVMERTDRIWYKLKQPAALGLPKPIQTILREMI